MSIATIKTKAKNPLWLSYMRYKVGQVVSWKGFQWANRTGHNSEPSTSIDWVQLTFKLTIDGFDVQKAPGNHSETAIQQNDRCEFFDWDTKTEFGFVARELPVSDENNRDYYKDNSI